MNRVLTTIGLVLTTIYFTVLLFLFEINVEMIRLLSLNELGDFLAGTFGPIAVLWLVLGFFQQGVMLKMNTTALLLQAEELKNTVIQQKHLAETSAMQFELYTKTESEKRRRSIEEKIPFFTIDISHAGADEKMVWFTGFLRNNGRDAFFMSIEHGLERAEVVCTANSLKHLKADEINIAVYAPYCPQIDTITVHSTTASEVHVVQHFLTKIIVGEANEVRIEIEAREPETI